MPGTGGRGFHSGRQTVTRRPDPCKKRAAVRKISTTSLDSGSSLRSSDSEDQVFAIHRGLGQCAALLQDILQCEAREKSMKTNKMSNPKVSVKGKRSVARKATTAPIVHKEKGILRKSASAGGGNVAAQRPRVTAQPPGITGVYRERLPSQTPVAPQCNDAAAPYNCRLPTSTPVLSPQRPGHHCANVGYQQPVPPGGAARSVKSPEQPSDLLSQLNNYKNHIRDSDLLQCVAAHLAQLQRSENPGPDRPEPACETSSEEEEVTDVRDGSCQTSFTNYNNGPESTGAQISSVTSLLGEIKALVAEQDDGEALRLVTQLEHFISLLPGGVGSVHAEVAIALQPLRSENAQLRRRLRIVNQQLRERERGGRSDEHTHQLTALQHQLDQSQRRNEEQRRELEEQRSQNQKLTQIIQDKEQEILHLQQQSDRSSAAMRAEVGDAVGKVKRLQLNLEDTEKENQILQISARQRDAEISRLRDLTRTLQAGMAKLLCDLGKENAKCESSLTQAALDSYDKQLRSEHCPASTSIMNYLQRLESDQVFSVSDKPVTDQDGAAGDSDHGTGARMLGRAGNCHEVRAPSESCYLTGDEYRPDETLYCPLVSSPRVPHLDPCRREMCTPPRTGPFSDPKPAASAPDMHLPTTRPKPALPPEDSQTHVLEPLRSVHTSAAQPGDRSELDFRSGKSDWTFCSFSTFTSHDEQDFRSGLAALDANIARLQRTLQSSARKE